MNMVGSTFFKVKRMKTVKQIISLLQEKLYESGLGTVLQMIHNVCKESANNCEDKYKSHSFL